MSKIYLDKEYTLTAKEIDGIASEIREVGEKAKIPEKYMVQLQYFVEELLLNTRSALGEEQKIAIVMEASFFKQTLSVIIPGEHYNPTEDRLNSDSYISALIENAGITHSYSYHANKENCVSVRIPRKKPSDIVLTFSALLLAVLAAWLLSFAPEETAQSLCNDLLSPVGNAFLSIITTCGVLMIFLSLVSGITHMTNIRQLKKSGAVVFRQIMAKNLLVILLLGFTVPAVLNIISGNAASSGSAAKQIFDLLIGIVPGNIIEPFETQNALQICFIAILLGVFMLIYKNETRTLAQSIDDLNKVVMAVIRAVCSLIPVYIFVAFLQILLSGEISALKDCWIIYAILIGYSFAYILITKLISRFVCRIPLRVNLKNSAKIGMLGFMTGSSMACLDQNWSLVIRKYHADAENVNFAIVIQQILYKVDVIGDLAIWVLCMAKIYHLQISMMECIIVLMMVFLMGLVVPPVPGGTFSVATTLFASIGLPAVALELFISTGVFSNMIVTGMKTFCVSDELVMIDRVMKKGSFR